VNTEGEQHLLDGELKLDARVPSCIGCVKLVELRKAWTDEDVTTQNKVLESQHMLFINFFR
jgi:hypothetical protein